MAPLCWLFCLRWLNEHASHALKIKVLESAVYSVLNTSGGWSTVACTSVSVGGTHEAGFVQRGGQNTRRAQHAGKRH